MRVSRMKRLKVKVKYREEKEENKGRVKYMIRKGRVSGE